jgi:hypothetical protein
VTGLQRLVLDLEVATKVYVAVREDWTHATVSPHRTGLSAVEAARDLEAARLSLEAAQVALRRAVGLP